VAALLVAAPSFAHQQKTAVTRLLFNANSGNLEVMHRLFLHDAEHAASVVFGEKQDLIESADSRALFGSYVVNRFAIALADEASTPVELRYLGEEIDGQYLWVYQEAVGFIEDFAEQRTGSLVDGSSVNGEERPSALFLVNSVLRDVWPEQANLVNVERAGRIASITFDQGADALLIELP
jgi:hypothetical protein